MKYITMQSKTFAEGERVFSKDHGYGLIAKICKLNNPIRIEKGIFALMAFDDKPNSRCMVQNHDVPNPTMYTVYFDKYLNQDSKKPPTLIGVTKEDIDKEKINKLK